MRIAFPGLLLALALLLVLLWLLGCVTSGDLREIASSLERVELVVDDPLATGDDLRAVLRESQREVASVARDVEERTREGLDTFAEVGGVAGAASALGAVGLNLWRNHRRRQRGEAVQIP